MVISVVGPRVAAPVELPGWLDQLWDNPPSMEIAPTAPLRASLDALADTLEGFAFRLPGPAQPSREDERTEVAWSIREYLIPRFGDLEAPVLAVVLGSTGSGKSTLVNSLAQALVSEVGALRPTTRAPVIWTRHPERYQDRYQDQFLTGYSTRPNAERPLRVVAGEDRLLENLSVLDAPDFDSVVEENRDMAEDLLAVADLCVFVTTAQRYADAVPWDFLRQAHRRGLPLLFVVNRLPPDQEARRQILSDYSRRLAAHEVLLEDDPGLLFAISEQETDPDHGGLPAATVARIREELSLLSDPGVRRQLIRQSTEGAVAEVIQQSRKLAGTVEEEAGEVEALRQVARLAYRSQMDEVSRLLHKGALIRGEVVARWQEFVGTGDLLKSLSSGVATLRRWGRTVLGGAAPVEEVGEEARTELVAAVVRRADLGAREAAAAWERDPAGKVLLAGAALPLPPPEGRGPSPHSASLWRHDPQTPERAQRAFEDWMAEVADLVAELGRGKQRTARLASLGVNAAAVVVLVSVFAHTGGITGAELGITAGAAAAQQKLLEHFFGSAAAQSLVEEARRRLHQALEGVLMADAGRFAELAGRVAPVDGLAARIQAQVAEVSKRAGAFYGH